MASELKRKRHAVEVTDDSKRAKVDDANAATSRLPDFSKVGWDAAFGNVEVYKELIPTQNGENVVDGEDEEEEEEEILNYDDLPVKEKRTKEPRASTYLKIPEYRKKAGWETRVRDNLLDYSDSWRMGDAIGGYMLNLDPVFVEDEKYLIVAYPQSLKVYSTSDSLLHAEIKLKTRGADIVAFTPSTLTANTVWVACADGAVYNIDWMTGKGADDFWQTGSLGTSSMTAGLIETDKGLHEVVFTAEEGENGEWQISLHELQLPGASTSTTSRVLYRTANVIRHLRVSAGAEVLVASSGRKVLVGGLKARNFESLDKAKYEFRVFETIDAVSTLDLRVSERRPDSTKQSKKDNKIKVVDLAVGDVRGAIFVHNDILAKLLQAESVSRGDQQPNLVPRKLHWHRSVVLSLKWSADGNYIISGAGETVMVLWQLETNRQQFLPHMSAAIENIVVSPLGTSYAVHLSDNSTIVLSTAELKPTTSISGIQARVMKTTLHVDASVRRVSSNRKQAAVEKIPALLHPKHPSRLMLAVGQRQQIRVNEWSSEGLPYIQTFDISTSYNIIRQALTRTNITNKTGTNTVLHFSEARIVHAKLSHNGQWLATVDTWIPPAEDVAFLGHDVLSRSGEKSRRREVFLKFWHYDESLNTWELVSRIDAPHSTAIDHTGAGVIFDLVADPVSLAFATIGEDGLVRVWRPRIRRRDGVSVKGSDGKALLNWACHEAISLGKPDLAEEKRSLRPVHGCLAFSDDGSALAASLYAKGEPGIFHIIDSSSGTVHLSRSLMFHGQLVTMAFLSQYLITVSDDLRVYDTVADRIVFEVTLGAARKALPIRYKVEMVHLAVDPKSQTFALALPTPDLIFKPWQTNRTHPLEEATQDIAIFSPHDAHPLITHKHHTLITALLATPGSPGYIFLDAAAEIRSLIPKTSLSLTATAAPLTQLQLDSAPPEAAVNGSADPTSEADDVEDAEDAEELVVADAMDIDVNNDDDDDGPPVITQQQLENIFDVGPASALQSTEDLFYQLAGLLASKPLAQKA